MQQLLNHAIIQNVLEFKYIINFMNKLDFFSIKNIRI